MGKKVLVGLSGGVDSAVCAYLLKEQGYEVSCVTMNFYGTVDPDAENIAKSLCLPFRILDVREQFKQAVEQYFVSEYLHARTPNPCIICNPTVKFASLLSLAEQEGFDYIATGHYARILQLPNHRYGLKKAAFSEKDQTYALYRLTQKQLSRLLLPLGAYSKDQVRDLAEKAGLPVFEKSDSQEICFIPDNDHPEFIKKALTKNCFPELSYNPEVLHPGNFVNTAGDKLGTHRGIVSYTIGQRKGLGVALGHPVYVCRISDENNEVVLGENDQLFTKSLKCNRISYMSTDFSDISVPFNCTAKIRYGHSGTPCTITEISPDGLSVTFLQSVRAITPGQSVVFYLNDLLLFGGIIL